VVAAHEVERADVGGLVGRAADALEMRAGELVQAARARDDRGLVAYTEGDRCVFTE
jgi:hypothetical protein